MTRLEIPPMSSDESNYPPASGPVSPPEYQNPGIPGTQKEGEPKVRWLADPSDIFLELDASDLGGPDAVTGEYPGLERNVTVEIPFRPADQAGAPVHSRVALQLKDAPASGHALEAGVSIDFGLFAELLQNLVMPAFLVDPEGSIIFANQAVSCMGDQFEQLREASLATVFPDKGTFDQAKSIMDRALKENRPLVKETVVNAYGSLLEATLQVRPLLLKGLQFGLISIEPHNPKPRLYDVWKYKRLFSIFPVGIGEFAFSQPLSHRASDMALLNAVRTARLVDGNNNFARMYGTEEISALLGKQKTEISPWQVEHQTMYLAWIRKFFPTGSFEISETGPDYNIRNIEVTLIGEVEQGCVVSFWELRQEITDRVEAEQRLRDDFQDMRREVVRAAVDTIGAIVERKAPHTARRQLRVAKLAGAIADEMGLSEEERLGLQVAAALHDIGEIFLPADLAARPAGMTEAELSVVRAHPDIGYDVLRNVRFPWPIAEIVVQHHERIDGSGYPLGLKGEEILLGARIIAVADVFEEMSFNRAQGRGHKTALSEIRFHNTGGLDPRVVRACTAVVVKGFSF